MSVRLTPVPLPRLMHASGHHQSDLAKSGRQHVRTALVNVRFQRVISTGRRNTGGQPAINNSDGLPNVRPIAFSKSLRNQLSHNVIFSAALVPLTYRPIIDLSPLR